MRQYIPTILLISLFMALAGLTFNSGGSSVAQPYPDHFVIANNMFYRSRNAADSADRNVIGIGSDDRTYIYARDASMRLTSGASSNIGIEVDTSQNVDIPIGELTASTVTLSGYLSLMVDPAPRTNITPGRAGSLIWNSSDLELCVSTGTAASTWVQAADGTSACSS